MVRFYAGFLRWWLIEIGDLLHIDLLRLSPNATLIDLDRETISLSIRKRNRTTALGQVARGGDLSSAVTDMLQGQNDRPDFNIISVSPNCVIKRHLSLPAAAQKNLDELLSYELERETPFTQEEVYWGYTIARRASVNQLLQVELMVIPKESVDHLRDTVRQLGLEPNGVEVQFEGSQPLFIPFRERRRVRRLGPQRVSRQSMALTAALALLAICLPFIFQQREIVKIDQETASLAVEAEKAMAIRHSMNSLREVSDFVAQERLRTGSVLGALAVTSRLIPTDSYLVALNLRKGHMTLSGLSPSAAKLISLLAQSSAFRDPAFVSPVIQSEGASLETFTITATPAPGAWQ